MYVVRFCQAVRAEELGRKVPQGVFSAKSMCLRNGEECGPEMKD